MSRRWKDMAFDEQVDAITTDLLFNIARGNPLRDVVHKWLFTAYNQHDEWLKTQKGKAKR